MIGVRNQCWDDVREHGWSVPHDCKSLKTKSPQKPQFTLTFNCHLSNFNPTFNRLPTPELCVHNWKALTCSKGHHPAIPHTPESWSDCEGRGTHTSQCPTGPGDCHRLQSPLLPHATPLPESVRASNLCFIHHQQSGFHTLFSVGQTLALAGTQGLPKAPSWL